MPTADILTLLVSENADIAAIFTFAYTHPALLQQRLMLSRDEEAITHIILESIRAGQAEIRENNFKVTDPCRIATALKLQIREVLEALARQGLLIG